MDLDIEQSALSIDYVQNKTQFQLHHLLTEQRHPKTWNLSQTQSSTEALQQLFSVDEDITNTLRGLVMQNSHHESVLSTLKMAVNAVKRVLVTRAKNLGQPRIFFYGCGATGRLSKMMESSLWRPFCLRLKTFPDCLDMAAVDSLQSAIVGEMTGGDRALISSLEGLEDLPLIGHLQLLDDHGFQPGDVLFAVTEGGETSSVIGSVLSAADAYGDEVKSKQNLFFVYNNPDELLSGLLRSKKVLEDPRISKIPLWTGPQAVTGSTRMQATTIETFVLGLILESAAQEMILECSGNPAGLLTHLGFNPEQPELKTQLESFASLQEATASKCETLARLTGMEAEAYKEQKKALYVTDQSSLLTVFTDCTERSPTFRLHPLDTTEDDGSKKCWIKVTTMEATNAEDAWEALLMRPFYGLQPQIYKEPFESQVTDAHLRLAALCSLTKAGDDQQKLYNFAFNQVDLLEADNPLILVTINQSMTSLISMAQSAGVKKIGLITFCPQKLTKDIEVVSFDQEDCLKFDPLMLRRNVCLKMLLNAHSTAVMAKRGRLVGNTMTSVSPSNLKLVGRATNLIAMHVNEALRSLSLSVTYNQANAALMDAKEFCENNGNIGNDTMGEVALCIVRILATIRNKLNGGGTCGPSWAEAMQILSAFDNGLAGFLASFDLK